MLENESASSIFDTKEGINYPIKKDLNLEL